MVTGNFTRRSAGRAELCAKCVQISTHSSFSFEKVVRARGLEPLSLAAPDPKSGVSANSTTRASLNQRRHSMRAQNITKFWQAASRQSADTMGAASVRLSQFMAVVQ